MEEDLHYEINAHDYDDDFMEERCRGKNCSGELIESEEHQLPTCQKCGLINV